MISERPRIIAVMGGAYLFGQERGNIEALAALQEQGCEVLCLIRDDEWSTYMAPALDARGIAWAKVPYVQHLRPASWFKFWAHNLRAFAGANVALWKSARRFRPSHFHSCNPVYCLNFMPALLLLRIPLVYRAGDEPTNHNWFWRMLWRFVVWRTGEFVANSKFIARSLQHWRVSADRLTVIYNLPANRRTVKGSGIPLLQPNARNIVYLGQISEHKGPQVLIEAFLQVAASYPTAHLNLVGPISDWEGDTWARDLRDCLQRDKRARDRFTFVGQVDDVDALFRECEFLVVPSIFEDPAPNVVMEAKESGRPSIVFPRGGLPELVEHGVDGWVCREASVPALVEALRFYLDDAERAPSQSAKARTSLGRLGVDKFAKSWLGVYERASLRRSKVPEASSTETAA